MQTAAVGSDADAPGAYFQHEQQDYARHMEEYAAGVRAAERALEQGVSDRKIVASARQSYEIPRACGAGMARKGLLFELAASRLNSAPYDKGECILRRADAILQKAALPPGGATAGAQNAHQARVVRMGALIRARMARKQRAMDSILGAAAGECMSCAKNGRSTCSLDQDWLIFSAYRGHSWRPAAQDERSQPATQRDGYRKWRGRTRKTLIAPAVIEEDCDYPECAAGRQSMKHSLATLSGPDFSTQLCELKTASATRTTDEQEIYFDRVEQMIREAELPADRMQALAALSHLGTINTAAYKDMLLKQVQARRMQYRAEQPTE